jgi:hypothetical protein
MAKPKTDRFEQFRLSLLVRPQTDIFGGNPTREEYLRDVFGSEHVFEHYSTAFHYLPHELSGGGAVLGRIGREVEMEENLPPSQGLQEAMHATWKAVVVAVDPVDSADGQKVAVKVDRKVGGALALITALVEHINETRPSSPYTIEVAQLFDTQSFWTWARAHEGQITDLTFTMIAPNGIFGTQNNVKQEMAAARQATNVDVVTVGLKSEKTLDVNVAPIQEAVDYAGSTGGKITGKAKDGSKYTSTTRPKTTTIETDTSDRDPLIVRAAKRVAEILGR